ncbi:jeltraxin-like [Bufo gargarizans]|uniref:jeltraxin-like n=1 Tax=Bufo gargarizans TaxID=30331 RepID=UPI001CF548B0|nr:jeltraxin-like [Bufo gargarizans]
MKKVSIIFLLFSGCFALQGKNILTFPKQTATDHVILRPTVNQPLNQLTVCLRSYTDLTREHSLFSIAAPGSGKDNTFLIFPNPPNSCSVYINQEEIYFKVDPDVLDWKHTCVAWNFETGLVELWINGKRYPRKGTKKGSPLGPEISVMLGQEQDTYGGGFQSEQSFVGEMRDVHMWDYVLPAKIVKDFCNDYYTMHGNIFNWTNGTHVIKGGAVVLED